MSKEGEIYWMSLDPPIGKEQKGLRPCVIVSGNSLNTIVGISMICPLSSNIKGYKANVLIKSNGQNKLTKDSEVLTHQIRTIDQQRLKRKIGTVSEKELEEIRKGVTLYLYE